MPWESSKLGGSRNFRRKHYLMFQEAIKALKFNLRSDPEVQRAVYEVATVIADIFEHDSDKFNREKFLEACEIFK